MEYPDINFIKAIRGTKRYIRENYTEFYQYIEDYYPKNLQWKQKLYWFYNKINDYPVCPICGKKLNFLDFSNGYRKYCSPKCAHNDPRYIKSIEDSNIKKYGVKNVFQNKEIQGELLSR